MRKVLVPNYGAGHVIEVCNYSQEYMGNLLKLQVIVLYIPANVKPGTYLVAACSPRSTCRLV